MRSNYTLQGCASAAISYTAIILGAPLNVNVRPSPAPIAHAVRAEFESSETDTLQIGADDGGEAGGFCSRGVRHGARRDRRAADRRSD